MCESQKRRGMIGKRSRAALLWLGACFFALQLGLDLLMERWQPVLRDPEYGYKLARLRNRLKAEPGKPLVLVLGSSRTNLGVCPAAMNGDRPGSAISPLVFNFSINGAGPRIQLMILKRLLADGICPQRIVVEILPPALHQDEIYNEEVWLNINRLGLTDLRILQQYSSHPFILTRHWLRSRLMPCVTHRHWFLLRYAHSWLRVDPLQPQDWSDVDRLGWQVYHRQHVDAEEYGRGLQAARNEYTHSLDRFHVTSTPDRALHDLISLCRQHQLDALLLRMPEASQFRAWYSSEALAEIRAYTARLCRECGATAIDARSWMPDDAFFDGHHLLPWAAVDFSKRLASSILPPSPKIGPNTIQAAAK